MRLPTTKISLLQELRDSDLAVIVLQSMIRGCATNVEMADGLFLSSGLMLELRTTDPLWEDSRIIMQLREQRQRVAREEQEDALLYVRIDPPISRNFNLSYKR